MREVATIAMRMTTVALFGALVALSTAGWAAEPAAATGVVKLSSEPAGATAYTGGAAYGPTPAVFELTPGKHTLIVTRDGYAPVTQEIVVRKDRITRVQVRLTVLPGDGIRVHATDGADAGPGTVTIATEPPGLTVVMNDVAVPLPTPVAFDLKAGVYELRLESEGKVVYRKTVFVRAGEITEIDVDLERRRRIDESDPWQ